MNGRKIYLEENEAINRFVQLTYQTLNSSAPVPLSRLESSYLAMNNVIHESAGENFLDAGAFSYVCSRLPRCIFSVKQILFGQSESILEENGVPMASWAEVYAKSRRRRYLYNGAETLIAFIASKSDIDDMIPALLAFQIEWNKAHDLLQQIQLPSGDAPLDSGVYDGIARALGITAEQLGKLSRIFEEDFPRIIATIREKQCSLAVQNYEASYCRYRKETEIWWNEIYARCPEIESRPIYFVSSNSHSLINVLSGFARYHETEILDYAAAVPDSADLLNEYHKNKSGIPGDSRQRKDNILFYLLMKYEQDPEQGPAITEKRLAWESNAGIVRIASPKTLDVPTQVIDLKKLARYSSQKKDCPWLPAFLEESNALILNIDYPLGRTAYFILDKIAEHATKLLGVYVIGKAASLIADRGDVIIPAVILDQHTRNQYFIENCMRAKDVTPFLDADVHGIYDNQRAVTVLGTLLQNTDMLYGLQAAGITDIEMEAGPYLSAVYEMTWPKRYSENETVSMVSLDMDLGIIHYVSDNPLSLHRLDNSLETDGVDSTYACTNAVLEKIFSRERRSNAQ
ncbi:DUF6909 family protein [Breznakiella homolactica]|uniref:Uncharacterized protein n=1 Tax=Breznakiella homolactica TaxID=2798577 RepID=A0A7T7XLD0_9SPIR|nr:hypothetical protein [Breznakiella homolactica]QQO08378.1 hypothetical protein JFL75_15775 [Breznakiella homolactica]